VLKIDSRFIMRDESKDREAAEYSERLDSIRPLLVRLASV
jgi:hypothetical protein